MIMMMMMMMMNSFCGMFDRRKTFSLISSRHHCHEILTIADLRNVASRIWTCAEPEFTLCWMNLSCSDNHYTPELSIHIIKYTKYTKHFSLQSTLLFIL